MTPRLPLLPIAAMALLLAACGSRDDVPNAAPNDMGEPPSPTSAPPGSGTASASRWDLQSSGERVGLVLRARPGHHAAKIAKRWRNH